MSARPMHSRRSPHGLAAPQVDLPLATHWRSFKASKFVWAASSCVAISLLMCGCQSAQWQALGSWLLAPPDPSTTDGTATDTPVSDAATKAPTPEAKSSTSLATSGQTDQPLSALPVPALTDDRWVMNVRPMVPGKQEPAWRWHHHALDPTLALSAARRPDVTPGLTNPNPVVVANAAILLGRWGNSEAVDKLVAAAQNVNLRTPLRQAAIETLGSLKSPEAIAAVDTLLGGADLQVTASDALTLIPDLHAELLAARAQHVAPAEDIRFAAAMHSKSALVRQEAAAAFARSKVPAGKATPAALIDLCSDTDTRVRVAALTALAVHHPPQAAETLTRATHDYDLNVRIAAIAALGELGSKAAKQSLDKLRNDPSEIARAAAIGALAAIGADAALISAATDQSPRVRQAVAESLKRMQEDAKALSHETQELARTLVQDVSSEVQREAVASLQQWPLDHAGPVLFLAMEKGSFLTRKLAAEQLSERWKPAASFVANATTERRAEQLAELRTQWERQFGTLDEQVVRAAATEVVEAIGLTDAQLALVDQVLKQLADPALPDQVRARAVRSLAELGPELVAALEHRTTEELRMLPPELYTVVLPEVSPLFKSLEQLTSPDLRLRRAAANELATQFKGQRVSELALQRLAVLVENESDPLIWQSVMAAIADDPRATAKRLAYIAVANTSSEVRRRACRYLESHPDRKHLEVLLPMLTDGDATVAIAAVHAIGAAGVEDPAPLIQLLNGSDRQLRLEAAIALAESQFDAGLAAIERLTHEGDLEIRRAATVAMGRIRSDEFLPRLIELIDDRRDVQIAAMASLAAIAGQDVGMQSGQTPLPDEQVRLWKRWYAERVRSE